MARNQILGDARHLSLAATDPATPASGDPVLIGQIPAVALTDERSDGTTTIDTAGAYNLSVKAVDTGGSAAVNPGDIIYYVSGDTPKLSRKNTGVRYGYALGAITSGSTATISVKLGY